MNDPNPFVGAVTSHAHVTIDEDVFHRYQEVAELARRLNDGQATMSYLASALHDLDEALAVSRMRCEMDPDHHTETRETNE